MKCDCGGARCTLDAGDRRHGTLYGYRKLGCRCTRCREEHLREQAAYRAANRQALNAKRRLREAHKRRHQPPRLRKPIAEIRRAKMLLEDGTSYAEVARTIGWDERTVARYFPDAGWDRATVSSFARAHSTVQPPRRPSKPLHEQREVKRLLDAGETVQDAARRVGWSHATVTRYFPDAPRMTPSQAGRLGAVATNRNANRKD